MPGPAGRLHDHSLSRFAGRGGYTRGVKAVSAALATVGTLLLTAAALRAADPPGRVVILGFDGVDSAVVEQMLAARRLPNLSALKARGGYSPLTPTVPAQTPVSWATFSTGLDPAATRSSIS